MTDDRSLERAARSWLETGPTQAPDRAVEAALLQIQTLPQERDLRIPWRLPRMNGATRYALAAVAVVAVALGGLFLFNRSPGSGIGGPAQSPSPSASLSPSPSTAPALTQTFTSDRYGISIDFPNGWIRVPATGPWARGLPGTEDGTREMISDPVLREHLFLAFASQPLAGKTGDEWAAAISGLAEWGETCPPQDTRPITVDGAPGVIVECASRPIYALTWAGDRGYFVVLYRSGDEPWLDGVYDRAWFEQVLGTVKLLPDDAVPGPSAIPSSNPSPSPS